jgi:hypothetical protein
MNDTIEMNSSNNCFYDNSIDFMLNADALNASSITHPSCRSLPDFTNVNPYDDKIESEYVGEDTNHIQNHVEKEQQNIEAN